MPTRREHIDDLRGATRLAVEATAGVADLVEAMQIAIAGGPALLGRPLEGIATQLGAPVFASVRGVAQFVGAGLDRALASLAGLVADGTPTPAGASRPERDAVVAALGGVLGDYLAATGNPLAIEMALHLDGRPLEPERGGGGQLIVFLHGSSMSEHAWRRDGHDRGATLARELGYLPLALRYNSGLHVSSNGRMLAELLERLVASWPDRVEQIALVGHSMGGLVARSAAHAGDAAGHRWRRALRTLVTLATPHHGASLERLGNLVHAALGVSRVSAPLGRLARIRSAGVTDLRFGNLLDADWADHDRFAPGPDRRTPTPLPTDLVACAVAATPAPGPGPGGELPGDGLVSVASALGRHRDPARTLGFSADHQLVVYRAGHLDLLDRREVWERLRGWLAETAPPGPAG